MDHQQFFSFVGRLTKKPVIAGSDESTTPTRVCTGDPDVLSESAVFGSVVPATEPAVTSSRMAELVPPATPRRESGERVYKVVFLGNASVGKTCLVKRLSTLHFPPTVTTTIGMELSCVLKA